MARSSILLKNLTPLVVGNVLGGKNLLIFGTINVTIHLTDLPGSSVLGSAQGFFLLSAREFFLATVALGLLIGGQFSVKQLCDKAPLLKAQYK